MLYHIYKICQDLLKVVSCLSKESGYDRKLLFNLLKEKIKFIAFIKGKVFDIKASDC